MDPAAGLDARLVVTRSDGFGLDVAVSIPPGSTAAMLGPNGAGKSTAASAIAGILALDEGRLTLGGRVLDDPQAGVFVPPEDRRIGVVFQQGILFPHLSVLDNVAFGLRSRGVGAGEARREAASWLDTLEVGDLARRRPGGLSGGQAQLVSLARALAFDPDALVLDEPLSALDVGARAQVRRMLARHLEDFAGPRLLITHDPAEAFLLSDRIHVVEHGAVTQEGTAAEILRHPRTSYAADLAGINLVSGTASGGVVTLDGGHSITIADTDAEGHVLAIIHPRSIALYREQPGGSPRNAWRTPVTSVEQIGDRCRVQVGEPLPLTAEVTSGAVAALGVGQGTEVWVAIKATEIEVEL